MNIAHNAYCRTLSILRMWLTLLVVQEVPGFLSWRCIMTTQIWEVVCMVVGLLGNKDLHGAYTCFVWCVWYSEGRLNYDSSDILQMILLIPNSSFQLEPKNEANFCFVELEMYLQAFEVIHVCYCSSIAFVHIVPTLSTSLGSKHDGTLMHTKIAKIFCLCFHVCWSRSSDVSLKVMN